MILFWYFACCIKIPFHDALVLLSIAEFLTRERPDRDDTVAAIDELLKMDLGSRLYTVPTLLAASRRMRDDAVAGQADELLSGIIDTFDRSTGDAARRAATAVSAGQDGGIAPLAGYVDAVKAASSVAAGPDPYADLKDRRGASLAITLIHHAVQSNEVLWRGQLALTNPDGEIFREFLQSCIDGGHGRFAFILAVEIASQTGFVNKEDLIQSVWRHSRCGLAEPDIHALYAKVEFEDAGVESLMAESVGLLKLKRWIAFMEAVPAGEAFHNPVLPRENSEEARAFPGILWQSALWNLAADRDQVLSIQCLEKIWRIPSQATEPRVVGIHIPGITAAAPSLKEAGHLLALRKPPRGKQREGAGVGQLSANPAESNGMAWTCYSPWLRIRNDYDQKLGRKNRSYWESSSDGLRFRLLSSTLLAASLAEGSAAETEPHPYILSLLVHSFHVTAYFGVNSNAVRWEDAPAGLSGPAFLLMAHARDRILGLARTRRVNPAPADFLKAAEELSEDSPHGSDAYQFAADIAPSVFVSWVLEAYPAAESPAGPGRWLDLVDDVVARCRTAKIPEFGRKMEAALVARFFSNDPSDVPAKLDWLSAGDNRSDFPIVKARQFLLVPNLHPAEWNRKWPQLSDGKTDLAGQYFVCAVERRASLKTGVTFDEEIARIWRADWLDALRAVPSPEKLDRLFRLRLCELLSDKDLKLDGDEQIAICLALVEYGSVYEIRLMLDEMFPFNASGILLESNSVDRDEARRALAFASFRYARDFADRARQSEPEDPSRHNMYQAKAKIFERVIRLLLAEPVWWREASRSPYLQPQEMKSRSGSQWKFDLLRCGTNFPAQELSYASGPPPKSWAVEAAVLDENTGAISVAHSNYPPGQWIDLISDDTHSLEELKRLAGERPTMLGLAVRDAQRERWMASCGLWDLLELKQLDPATPEGVPVVFSVSRQESGNRRYFAAVWSEPAERLRRQPSEGSVQGVTVACGRSDVSSDVSLTLEGGNQALPIKQEEWNPFLYHVARPAEITGVQAKRGSEGYWLPEPGNFLDLLSSISREPIEFRNRGEGVVLRFAGRQEDSVRGNWLWAAAPGRVYLLTSDDFQPEAASALVAAIGSIGDAVGLAVRVYPVYSSQSGVLLALQKLTGEECWRRTDESYEIDDDRIDLRAVYWRDLFQAGEYVEVYGQGQNRFVQVESPIPGFPDAVRAKYVNAAWRSGALATVTGWDHRKGILGVESAQQFTLNVPEAKRADFVRDWIFLEYGSQLCLDRTIGEPDQLGTVRAVIAQGPVVSVESESLSFGAVGRTRRMLNGRVGLVTNAKAFEPETYLLGPEAWPADCEYEEAIDGVVASVPDEDAQQIIPVTIWWLAGDRIAESRIRLSLGKGSRIFVGCIVRVVRTEGGCALDFTNRRILVRALWRHVPVRDSLTYLGSASNGKMLVSIAEVGAEGAGTFAMLDGSVEGRHLASGTDASALQGGLSEGSIPVPAGKGPVWQEHRVSLRRVKVPFGQSFIYGVCDAQASSGNVTVNVSMWLRRAGPDLWEIRRYFGFSHEGAREYNEFDVEDRTWQARIEEYFADTEPEALRVEALPGGAKARLSAMRVPADPTLGPAGTPLPRRWTLDVAIEHGEGSYIPRDVYSGKLGQLVLYRKMNGCVRGSFRRVRAASLHDYMGQLSAQAGDSVKLKSPLRYTGRFEQDEQRIHRFEWAPGFTLEAAEEDLRFDGGDFRRARHILFRGDAIGTVRFEETAEDPPRLLMCIDTVTIEFSRATRVYRQSKHGVIHLLAIRPESERVRILSIVGPAETVSLPHESYDVPEAALDIESERVLWERYRNVETQEYPRVLGRLDRAAFEDSFGERVIFRHVILTFRQRPNANVLADGDFVFMASGRLVLKKNDLGIELLPYGLHGDDIGKDLREGCVLWRRQYSEREDALARVLERGGWNEKQLFLVRLGHEDDRITASLTRSRSLVRRESVLLNLVNESAAPVLAVVSHYDVNDLRLEFKPGAFFHLRSFVVRSARELAIVRGSVVRIAPGAGGPPQVSIACFSDERYVPTTGRAAICLPKNTLLSDTIPFDSRLSDPAFWMRKNFSIGGLPDIQASPGYLDPRSARWLQPSVGECRALMQVPHPKVVHLARDARGDFRVARFKFAHPGGTLEVQGLQVSVSLPHGGKTSLRWADLTFAEESAADVVRRCESEKWRLHDVETGHWTEKGLARTELNTAQNPETVIKGPSPVFFEVRQKRHMLSYSSGRFTEFGYPASALVDSLESKPGKAAAYSIAGPGDARSIWVEICPGRISEIPLQLLVLRSGGSERSLANLNATAFSAGDRIELRLYYDQDSSIDRLEFVNWMPGVRSALGAGLRYLAVAGVDVQAGAARAGAGAFTLTIPTSEPARCLGATAVVDVDGCAYFQRELPVLKPGDSVLLTLSPEGRAVVSGLPEFRPVPASNSDAWAGDELHDAIGRSLTQVIRCCGGAMPITVEGLLSERQLSFSRRMQIAGSPPGESSLVPGKVCGLLPNSATVIVRIGRELRTVLLPKLVAGLPSSQFQAVAEMLRNRTLWFRVEQGQLMGGLCEDAESEFAVERVGCLGEGRLSECGAIFSSVESKALFWVPARESVWAWISNSDVELIGAGASRWTGAPVAEGSSQQGLSLIRVAGARREFRDLVIGKELDVIPIRKRMDGDRETWLATAVSTGLLVECESPSGQDLVLNKRIRVEVVYRTEGRWKRIVAVPQGARRLTLSLPATLLKQIESDRGWSDEFGEFIQAALTSFHSGATDVESLRALAAADPARALIAATFIAKAGPLSARTVAALGDTAMEWRQRSRFSPEVKPYLALNAILLLDRLGRLDANKLAVETPRYTAGHWRSRLDDWQWESVAAFHQLALRAMTSLHAEIVWRFAFKETIDPNVQRRLAEIRPLFRNGLTPSEFNRIAAFGRALRLRRQGPRPLADALAAATCADEDLRPLLEHSKEFAPIASRLVQIYRTLPVSETGLPKQLFPITRLRLEEVLREIRGQRLDLTFGRPLPLKTSAESEDELRQGPAVSFRAHAALA